jgi:hypothetical protein
MACNSKPCEPKCRHGAGLWCKMIQQLAFCARPAHLFRPACLAMPCPTAYDHALSAGLGGRRCGDGLHQPSVVTVVMLHVGGYGVVYEGTCV